MLLNLINKINRFSSKFSPHFTNSGVFGLFLLSPLLAFPNIIYRSFKGERTMQILLSIFFGLLSICFVPPRADLYRHYLNFFEIKQQNFNEVVDNLTFDFFLPFIKYFVSHCGLDFEIIRLIFVSIPYLLFLNIYNYLKTQNNDKENIIIFLYCIFSVPFMDLTLGIRNASAISLISYVLLKKSLAKRKLRLVDYYILLLGPCIHFSTIWYAALVLFYPFIPKRVPKLLMFAAFIVAFTLSYQFDHLLKMLVFDNATTQLVNHYGSEGRFGTRYVFHNFIGSVPEYYTFFIRTVIICIFMLYIPCNKATVIPWSVIIVWAFTHTLYTISGRIDMILIVLCPLYIFKLSKFKNLFLTIIVTGAMLVAIINWRAYTISHSLYILFPPIITLALGYDHQWMQIYMDPQGALYIYKR